MDINTSGLEQLIIQTTEFLANFDIKALDFTALEELLTFAAPIWNPIWQAVTTFLETYFGF
ncbi:MAG: hypothetical protein J6A60_04350 [Clostridia bacterium]|nr:hypothetical protein [Clostridia bacterium]